MTASNSGEEVGESLEFETGLSRHTIVRARRGQPVHARSLRLLKDVVRLVPVRKVIRQID